MKKTIPALLISIFLMMWAFPVAVAAVEAETTSSETTPIVETTVQVVETDAPAVQVSDNQSTDSGVQTALWCALISFAGVIISCFSSNYISKKTAASEIKKMKLAWNREDQVSSENDYNMMAVAVAKCAKSPCKNNWLDAIGKVTKVRMQADGEAAHEADQLYAALSQKKYATAEQILEDVIVEKRKRKSYSSGVTG